MYGVSAPQNLSWSAAHPPPPAQVTHWTGALPFVLPDEQAFDLYPARKGKGGSKEGLRKLGRVGLARELRAPFLDRIEFPDEWVLAHECGVDHDGWQVPSPTGPGLARRCSALWIPVCKLSHGTTCRPPLGS